MTGSQLAVAIEALGLNQKDFAEATGIRRETINRWVKGHQPIPKYIDLLVEKWLVANHTNTNKQLNV